MRTNTCRRRNTAYKFEFENGHVGKAEARERLQDYMILAMSSKDLAVGLQETSETVNAEFLTVPARLIVDGVDSLREMQRTVVSCFDREFAKRQPAIVSSVMRDVKKKHRVAGLGTQNTQRLVRSRMLQIINANVIKQRKTVVASLQIRALFVYFARVVEKQRMACGDATALPLYRDFSYEKALEYCVHMYDTFGCMFDDTDFPLTSDILYAPVLSTLDARHQFDRIDMTVYRLEFLMRRYIQYELLEQTSASIVAALAKSADNEEEKAKQKSEWGGKTTLPHSAIEMIRDHGSAFLTTEMSRYTQQHEAFKWLQILLKIHAIYRKMERMLNEPEIRENSRRLTGLREKFIGRLCTLFDVLPEKEIVRRTMMRFHTYMRAESSDWRYRISLNLTTTCDIEMSCNVLNDIVTTYDILESTLYTTITRARRMYDTLSELSYCDVSERMTNAFAKQIKASQLGSTGQQKKTSPDGLSI